MTSRSRNSPSLSKEALEEAWISLLGFYGRAFEAQYGGIDGEQFRLWFAGLCSNAITDKMVSAAIRAVSTDHVHTTVHPPNFADFLRLCKNSGLTDFPSEDAAFSEASLAARNWHHHVWSSAAIYHAALTIGAWSLRHYAEKVTRAKFVDSYRDLVKRQRAGELLESPPAPACAPIPVPRVAPDSAGVVLGRRERMAALSRALLELPDHLQSIATDAIKNGRFVDPHTLFPEGLLISALNRTVLLEYCCNVVTDSPLETDGSAFSPSI